MKAPWVSYEETDEDGLKIWIEENIDAYATLTVASLDGYNEALMRDNARLICAAPDLLAACEEALEKIDSDGHEFGWACYAATLRAAIAKATGR